MSPNIFKLIFACIIFVNRVNGEGFAWQESGRFQGDIALTPEQQNGFLSKNMILLQYYLEYWPDATLIVYYIPEITATQKSKIQEVFDDITSQTCVKIREKLPGDQYYVNITNYHDGCFSQIGRTKPNVTGQQLNLQDPGCFSYSTIYHEFLHSLGMAHMQSDPTRVGKVIVDFSNVEKDQQYNFDIFNWTSSYHFQYDYLSVMHYDSYAFAKDKSKPTMWRNTTDPTLKYVLGNNDGPTDMDIDKLRFMYQCP